MARKSLTGFDNQGQRLQNVATPAAASDAANKAYVDAATSGGSGGGLTTTQVRAIARRQAIVFG